MRVLFVRAASRPGGWLADALATDGAAEVSLEEAAGAAEGMSRLRDDVFDTVLISHTAAELDAIELLDAVRTGSTANQPIIVLGEQSEHEMRPLCYEVGADAYLCIHTTTTRTLLWEIARATQRHQLISENRHLKQTDSQRLCWEREAGLELLTQQRQMIENSAPSPGGPADRGEPPEWLLAHFRQLLRIYVVMGSGTSADDARQLARRLADCEVTMREALRAHSVALEELLDGLGNRSGRHVMNRAHLLAMELMLQFVELNA